MTDKDKKLILEFCGWHHEIHEIVFGGYSKRTGWYYGKQFRRPDAPPLDLNFYFKCAYPQIPKFERYTFLSLWIIEVVNGTDPAEAFGQALLKLIKEK